MNCDLYNITFQFHICVHKLLPPLIILNHSQNQIHSLSNLIKTMCDLGPKTIHPFVNLVASGERTTASFYP